MKIRTITVGVTLRAADFSSPASLERRLRACAAVSARVSAALQSDGYEIQTCRVACNPLGEWARTGTAAAAPDHAEEAAGEGEFSEELLWTRGAMIAELMGPLGIDFCAVGPARTAAEARACVELMRRTEGRLSMSVAVPTEGAGEGGERKEGEEGVLPVRVPDMGMCREAARTTLDISRLAPHAARNFGFCASFNCPPGVPFFPAAYHSGPEDTLRFSVGLENGDLLFLGFFGTNSLGEARSRLAQTLEQALGSLDKSLQELDWSEFEAEHGHKVTYGGVDTSINPSLELPDSVGTGFEHLEFLVKRFGGPGTLSTAAMVTQVLKSVPIRRTGYCGLMLPVMEDALLAERASEEPKPFGIRELMLLSSVCGVGIDTVPIPGDCEEEDLASLMMDVASLAYRLDKPLSCRVLPMQGKKAGDLTESESPYLLNTRVFSLS